MLRSLLSHSCRLAAQHSVALELVQTDGLQLLRLAGPQTLLSVRSFSTDDASSQPPGPAASGDGAADREARRQQVAARLMQGKSWRSWVERKLDETIADKQPQWEAVDEEVAATLEADVLPLEAAAAAAGDEAAADELGGPLSIAAAPAAAQPRSRTRGAQLEQEIFDIVFDRTHPEAAEGIRVPPGMASRFSALVEAKDAPEVVRGGAAKAESVSPARIHPYRLFYPGQHYSPQDLDPYKSRELDRYQVDQHPGRRPIPPSQVIAKADFRNPQFLSAFITESGKLVPRRRTQLRQKLHRHLCRQVKLARQLGLMAPDAKVIMSQRGRQSS